MPDGGRLVDDDDAVPVGVVEHLLVVGVVRRAERVRAEPLQQREVVDHERVVVALAVDRDVLVLAEAGEVERLAVDQEARAVHGDRADADRQRVDVDQRRRRRPAARRRACRGSPRPAATGGRPSTVSSPGAPSPRATSAPSASRSATRTVVARLRPSPTLVARPCPVGAVEAGDDGDVVDVRRAASCTARPTGAGPRS